MNALVQTVKSAQHDKVVAILGPEMEDALKGIDPRLLPLERDAFVSAAKKSIKIERDEKQDRAIAFVGDMEWPFPAPLVKDGDMWRFDRAEGLQEVFDRRIGRDELTVVESCRGYVDAQLEYSSMDRDGDGTLEYAQKILSTPGKMDGLCWSNDQGGDLSPLGPFLADASAVQGGKSYAGYFFKILTRQGPAAKGGAHDYLVGNNMVLGFAMVAWPAEYGKTGIMTFIVNQLGDVYQKDLGEQTATAAQAITAFDPDPSWTLVPLD
jgi:hypothetical protein